MSPWRINGVLRADGLLILPVWLNERSFNFLFDPGAAYSTIKPGIATLLSLPVVGKQFMLQGGYYLTHCPVYQIDLFRIGSIRRSSVRMVELSLAPQLNFNGLLGMDFLKHYRFTVEPDTATLILRPLRK